MKQTDIEPLAAAVKAGNFSKAQVEFEKVDAFPGRIDVGKGFCIDHIEAILEKRVNLGLALLFAAMLRRHRRSGDFNPLDYFFKRVYEVAKDPAVFPQFFQMHQLLAAKRRDKSFFLYDVLSQKTYPYEVKNTGICKDV
ncbi:MAG: hypothetical protein AAFR21_18980, partial [Pseudomonadota bacterium]